VEADHHLVAGVVDVQNFLGLAELLAGCADLQGGRTERQLHRLVALLGHHRDTAERRRERRASRREPPRVGLRDHGLVIRELTFDEPCRHHGVRSEEHTSKLQSRFDLVCRLLLEKNKFYRMPFFVVPVTKDNKSEAEQKIRSLLKQHDLDFIFLARYMQILSN